MKINESEHIVHQLYDSLLDETAFHPAIAALGTLMGNRRAMLLNWNGGIDEKPDIVSTHAAQGPSFDTFLQRYGDYYHQFDPTKFKWTTIREGAWLHEDESFAPAVWSSDHFYQDFALQQRVIGWAVLKISASSPEKPMPGWAITFIRDTGEAMLDPSLLAHVQEIYPHLRRALLLRSKLVDLRDTTALGLAALERFELPLWLLESNGRIRFSNTAAERHLQSADALLQIRSGILHPVGTGFRSQWEALMLDATALRFTQAGGLKLTGKSGKTSIAQCLPLSAATRAATDWQRPMRMLVLHDSLRPPRAQHALLRQLYGFTPAEIRIGMDLLMDATIAEIAASWGTQSETVRGQVKSMLHKTGCRRQAELVRLLSSLLSVG